MPEQCILGPSAFALIGDGAPHGSWPFSCCSYNKGPNATMTQGNEQPSGSQGTHQDYQTFQEPSSETPKNCLIYAHTRLQGGSVKRLQDPSSEAIINFHTHTHASFAA